MVAARADLDASSGALAKTRTLLADAVVSAKNLQVSIEPLQCVRPCASLCVFQIGLLAFLLLYNESVLQQTSCESVLSLYSLSSAA